MPTQEPGDWLGMGAAAHLLGVAPGTLRRWSDAGQVPVFTTPGGHRRYRRASLERLVADRLSVRPSLIEAGLTRSRLVQAYRHHSVGPGEVPAWLRTLDAAHLEAFRVQGRQLVTTLLAHLDATDPDTAARQLTDAQAHAAGYGRLVAGLGASLGDAVEGFLAFRRPFLGQLASVAVQRGFDAATTTDAMDGAERAMDRLLLAVMTGYSVHQVAAVRRSRRPPRIQAGEAQDA